MNLKRFFPLVIFSAIFFIACDSDSDKSKPIAEDNSVVVKNAGEGERTEIEIQNLPEPVKTRFETKYVKAEDIKWVSYKPVPADNWDMDKDFYFVTYRWNYIPYEAWYSSDGNVIKEEEKIYLPNSGDLPREIVKSIIQNYPGFEIVETDKENDKDIDMYEVELHKGEEKAKVKFLMNGKIYKAK